MNVGKIARLYKKSAVIDDKGSLGFSGEPLDPGSLGFHSDLLSQVPEENLIGEPESIESLLSDVPEENLLEESKPIGSLLPKENLSKKKKHPRIGRYLRSSSILSKSTIEEFHSDEYQEALSKAKDKFDFLTNQNIDAFKKAVDSDLHEQGFTVYYDSGLASAVAKSTRGHKNKEVSRNEKIRGTASEKVLEIAESMGMGQKEVTLLLEDYDYINTVASINKKFNEVKNYKIRMKKVDSELLKLDLPIYYNNANKNSLYKLHKKIDPNKTVNPLKRQMSKNYVPSKKPVDLNSDMQKFLARKKSK